MNLDPVDEQEEEDGSGVEGEVGKGCKSEESTSPGETSQPNYYNLPSTSEIATTAEKVEGVSGDELEMSHEHYYNLAPGRHSLTSSESSADEDEHPSLDQFLARILQQRRESKDTSQACDEGEGESVPSLIRPSVARTQSSDSKYITGMLDLADTSTAVTTPRYPPYYNMSRLLGGKSEEEEEEGEEELSDEEGEWVDREEVSEKEFRSEWLTGENRNEANGENEDGELDSSDPHFYLPILPSSSTSELPGDIAARITTNTTATDAVQRVQNEASGSLPTEQHSSVPEGRDSPSTPDSGSPLWGANRSWSRPGAPSTQESRENSPGVPTFPETDPPLTSRRRQGSRKWQHVSWKRRPSASEKVMFQWPSTRRESRKRRSIKVHRDIFSRLPSIPPEIDSDGEVDVDSDYEWTEILSDTGSDHIYTQPRELEPECVECALRHSTSCSALDDLNVRPISPDDVTSQDREHFLVQSISQRPPAPLPTTYQGTVMSCYWCMFHNACS